MSNTLEIADRYFELSNTSDLESIREMFSVHSTYSSESTGIYLGRDSIMNMMADFHGIYSQLHWTIRNSHELRPGIIVFDFEFKGCTKDGETVEKTGTEYVVVVNDMLQHIEVRYGQSFLD